MALIIGNGGSNIDTAELVTLRAESTSAYSATLDDTYSALVFNTTRDMTVSINGTTRNFDVSWQYVDSGSNVNPGGGMIVGYFDRGTTVVATPASGRPLTVRAIKLS